MRPTGQGASLHQLMLKVERAQRLRTRSQRMAALKPQNPALPVIVDPPRPQRTTQRQQRGLRRRARVLQLRMRAGLRLLLKEGLQILKALDPDAVREER